MAFHISDLWDWRGTVGRGKYLAIGVILFGVKHLLDRIIASVVFGQPWDLFNYWVPVESVEISSVPLGRLRFYATLVAVALPFIWVGLVLTLRRLRDIGWPLWLTAIFFIPFVNVLFFAILSAIPSAQKHEAEWRALGLSSGVGRFIPKSAFGSAVVGVVVTSLGGVGVAVLSANGLGNYGWGLFVGLPFFLGLSSVLVYGYHAERSIGYCLLVSMLSVAVAAGAILALAFEGLICLLMAAPLGLIMAIIGGTVGYIIIQRRPGRADQLRTFSVLLIAFPTLLFTEAAVSPEPALREVSSAVTIDAPPEKVWRHLIAFTELPPPDDALFRAGIAYPLRAEIQGSGVGSVRHCVFSTGAFVEPIEVWNEPHLLRFGVTAQPPVMHEWSPFANVSPPHLENYLQSRKGQFMLTKLPTGGTLLEGTTWYQNKFWPADYWGLWSDRIIQRIHLRVLTHIKAGAEASGR
jgi:uncharacterized membrane protein YhaH (DUF805 family)